MPGLASRPTICLTVSRACYSRYARPLFPQDKPLKTKNAKIPWRTTNKVYFPNANFWRPKLRDDHTMAARVKYPVKLENGELHYRMIHYPRPGAPPDPPHKAKKLLLVMLVKPLVGANWKARQVLNDLAIDLNCKAAIVKSTPEMCAKLDLISGFTEIVPCELPENFEDDPNPLNYFIHEDGKIESIKDLKISEKDLTEGNAPLTRKYLDHKVREHYQQGWATQFN